MLLPGKLHADEGVLELPAKRAAPLQRVGGGPGPNPDHHRQRGVPGPGAAPARHAAVEPGVQRRRNSVSILNNFSSQYHF